MRKINPVPVSAVQVTSSFWERSMNLVRDEVIPYQWNALNDKIQDAEPSRCIKNLEIAAGRCEGEFHGFVFQDSDLYKWIESAAFALGTCPNNTMNELEEKIDYVVELLEEVQMPDGYLNTYFQLKAPESRWTNLHQAHELYCAGHLIEAAVAYAEVKGKKRLLNIAIKFADLIDSLFGAEDGKCKGYPGHQEIELALVKLWQYTKEERYLKLADFFIKERGSEPYYFDEEKKIPTHIAVWPEAKRIDKKYNQSHLHPVDQTEATGHAVRAVYMYSAMADLAVFNGDESLLSACRTIYENIVSSQMYITGGIGASHHGEAFTCSYDLPNDSAYAETCASIGLMMFCSRMHLIERDGRYIDTLERALYNTVLSGMSLTGREFFYVNPLSVHIESCKNNPGLRHVKPVRQSWFACACCPPNVARTLMALGSYAYSASDDEVFVNLYLSSKISLTLSGGAADVSVETKYPWKGSAKISATGKSYKLYLRNPSYAPVTNIIINGKECLNPDSENGYIIVPVSGDTSIDLIFDIKPRQIYSHSKAHNTIGKTAVCVGPVVYCAESADNKFPPDSYYLPKDATFTYESTAGSLSAPLLSTMAKRLVSEDKSLYTCTPPVLQDEKLTLVPYHMWGNRGMGDMTVYLNSIL